MSIPDLFVHGCSPACLFHTWYRPLQRIHSELKSAHPKLPQHTSSHATHYTSIFYLRRSCIAVHGSQFELGFRADPVGEGGVADQVPESLSVDSNRVSIMPDRRAEKRARWTVTGAYRCGSNCSNVFRLVWSRMILELMKQPRSSFFERNCDILDRYVCRM